MFWIFLLVAILSMAFSFVFIKGVYCKLSALYEFMKGSKRTQQATAQRVGAKRDTLAQRAKKSNEVFKAAIRDVNQMEMSKQGHHQ